MKKVSAFFVFAVAVLFAFTVPTYAQDKSSWGAQASFTPQWRSSPLFEQFASDTDVNLRGSDFSVGLVRGRVLSGDWGISFVRKSLNDSSYIITDQGEGCFDDQCFQVGDVYRFRKASMTGFQVHKFVPFATIKKRVQIGMNFAGGLSTISGSVEERSTDVHYNEDHSSFELVETTSTKSAGEALEDAIGRSSLPTARIEGVLAFIVSPNLKLKVSSGVGIPDHNKITIGLAYFF